MKALLIIGLVCLGLVILFSGRHYRHVWFGRVVVIEPVHLAHWRR